MQTLRLFTFEVPPISGPLRATIVQQSVLNGSILVNFSANREDAAFKCSIGQGEFQTCKFNCVVSEHSKQVTVVLSVDW